jgi:hypothetical protein
LRGIQTVDLRIRPYHQRGVALRRLRHGIALERNTDRGIVLFHAADHLPVCLHSGKGLLRCLVHSGARFSHGHAPPLEWTVPTLLSFLSRDTFTAETTSRIGAIHVWLLCGWFHECFGWTSFYGNLPRIL